MIKRVHNPDVLTCIANLSNDEVFTPPKIVNQMLDTLPEELWSDEKATFLDPVCKSGVFLREITKRLIIGLENNIPNLEDRIEHILHNQVYGIGITELTSLISRRSLYCSKYANGKYSIVEFDNKDGNLKYFETEHKWENGKCVYCGVGKTYDREEGFETYAYSFIHTNNPNKFFNNMKFDVIIGNPPYQMTDGGSGYGKSATPIYDKFVIQAKKLNPRYLSMIIPSRWFAGGRGLNSFREEMLSDKRIEKIYDFMSSKECFPGVNIAGGINYFLWNRDYSGECEVINVNNGKNTSLRRSLNEYDVFIRDNKAVEILKKVKSNTKKFLSEIVFQSSPFGFRSFARGDEKEDKSMVKLLTSDGFSYVSRDKVIVNYDEIDKYKVIIGKVVPSNGEVDVTPEVGYRVITNSRVLKPNEINSESYLLLATFELESEAENFKNYMRLKFPRFLLKQTLSSMNISKSGFSFVPFLDFSKKYTDEELFKAYNLSEDEKTHITSIIREI
jgi:site-specific DNA-methyltransferase (adenine-specific)